MKIIEDGRQMLYPREFRIDAPQWSAEAGADLAEIARLLRTPPPVAEPATPALLAAIGTRIWRMRNKMLQPGTDIPLEGMRPAVRDLQSAWDVLAEAGLKIIDHTGEIFDPGKSIKYLAFQPMPELTCEMIIETVKPTILLNGARIQMGEVIVGRPTSNDANNA